MPRELKIVTRRVPDRDDLRAAAADAGFAHSTVARIDGGVFDLIRDASDAPLLTVESTERIVVPGEIDRLAPAVGAVMLGPVFWTAAWSRAEGDTAERIAAHIAARCDGVVMRENGSLV